MRTPFAWVRQKSHKPNNPTHREAKRRVKGERFPLAGLGSAQGLALALVAVLLTALFPTSAHAAVPLESITPHHTFTWSPEFGSVHTQQAYEAIATLQAQEMRRPEDMVIHGDYLYVADSQTRQIIVFDAARNVVRTVGTGYLRRPTGVAVNAAGEIFVADYEDVVHFGADGTLINRITRPEDVLFGVDAPFRPRKIELNARGDIFVVSEAGSNGVVVLNSQGDFLNYTGVNNVHLNMLQRLQNIFTPRDQRQFIATPLPPTNLTIDDRGTIFTVTAGLPTYRIKRLNVAGENILDDLAAVFDPVDIAMANHGGFFVLSAGGSILEYTAEGDLLFHFGAQDLTAQRLGVMRLPSSIVQDAQGNLYVADATTGLIHIFTPTEFTHWVHLAITYFQNGRYVESMAYWQEVLRFHSAFAMAHLAIGHALFLHGDYAQARVHFEMARYISGYSASFWEIRSEWLYANAGALALGGIGLWLFAKGLKKARAGKPSLLDKTNPRFPTLARTLRELAHVKKVWRAPVDAFYDIRYLRKAGMATATVLYVALLAAFFVVMFTTGFVFAPVRDTNVQMALLIFAGIVALFVVLNYMVATVNEGEGSFRDIYVGTAFTTSPFIVAALPISLLTRVLTLNEEFVYLLLIIAVVAWSVLLLFIMLKEMHDYNIRDTIKNILLTVFAGAVAVLVAFVLYLLLNQVYLFISNIVAEVSTRV